MITIYGNDEEILSTQLSDLINCFEQKEKLIFLIKHLEGISSKEGFNQLEFENMIRSSQFGVRFDFKELLEIEKRTHQLIEIEIDVLEDLDSDPIAEILLIDGAYWEVSFPSDKLVKRLLGLEGAKLSP